ncbi:MAG: GNAT family N-acetyltransferase [Chloroflexota bacterium]|nr:GNAT family N-acetyltransferase [Chloroflexota bacterium]
MNIPFAIRSAREDDLVAIVRLLAEDELGRLREDVVEPLPAFYVAAFREIDRDPRHELLVVEDAGEVVATAQLSFLPSLTHRGGERAQIEGVRVAASRRGTGIGRALFARMIARAERRGCRMVQLTTDKRRGDARRFYESLGFEATHEGMKLTLPSTT